MFERVMLQVSSSEDYLDLAVLTGFFTLLSVWLVRELVPFTVAGQNLAGLVVVLFVSLAVSYPFVHYLLTRETEEFSKRWTEKTLLKRHGEEILFYLIFFAAVTIAIAVSMFFVPDSFYSLQESVLDSIGAASPTGDLTADAWGPVQAAFFDEVFRNNLWVFTATFLLTFFVSAGILFILVWNASVLGVQIGRFSETILHVPVQTLPYVPHGIFEISGFILAGIAGALLSYEAELMLAEERPDIHNFIVLRDVALLIIIGAACIFIGAVIETMAVVP